jgi:hypothetical protein
MLRHAAPILALAAACAAASPTALAAPPGYVRIQTPLLPAPAGVQSGGQVDCPAGKVPWGGGAGFAGGLPDFGMDLNTSAPSGTGWKARYNNRSSRAATFVVQTFCARKPRRYTTTFALIDNPPCDQATATATCPARTVLLGGGTQSTSDLPQASITSAWPSSDKTFTGVMWNGTAGAERLAVFAICGKRPKGYEIVLADASAPGPSDILMAAQCPGTKTLISGGLRVIGPQPAVTLGASFQDSGEQWVAEVLANTSATVESTAYAVCAA